MRVCQRCGAETTEARCPACGYTSFIDLDPATERPAAPPQPTPVAPAPQEQPLDRDQPGAEPLPGLLLARRRGWWTLGLWLFPVVCSKLGAFLTWLVPDTAAGCLPLTVSLLAVVLATVGYLSQVPLLLAGLVVGVLALLAWRQAVRPPA